MASNEKVYSVTYEPYMRAMVEFECGMESISGFLLLSEFHKGGSIYKCVQDFKSPSTIIANEIIDKVIVVIKCF